MTIDLSYLTSIDQKDFMFLSDVFSMEMFREHRCLVDGGGERLAGFFATPFAANRSVGARVVTTRQ